MYERFTDRAKKVMLLAEQEAQRLNHEHIAPEHVLLGLIKEDAGVAAFVFKNREVDLPRVRREVEKLAPPGPDLLMIGAREPTDETKKLAAYAAEERVPLNHNYTGTEHLLLGLLRVKGSVASAVLENLELKTDDLRTDVLQMLGHDLT
jgi:ATP-dependent Clp protease ATP-binding subunit ClpC